MLRALLLLFLFVCLFICTYYGNLAWCVYSTTHKTLIHLQKVHIKCQRNDKMSK